MRRATAVVAACFYAMTGCRGGAAQEPYAGPVVTTRAPAAQAPEAEPMASEVDVPWAIALLSDARAPVVNESRRIVVDREPAVDEPLQQQEADGDLEVAVERDDADERRQPPKSCSGVVNRRS